MQYFEVHKAVKAVCIVGVIIATHQEAQAAVSKRWMCFNRSLSLAVGLTIFKTRTEDDLGDDAALAKKLLLAGKIKVRYNNSPPYGISEVYTAPLSAGEWIRCERLSRTKGEKEDVRCFMQIPRLSYYESVPVSSSGFYLLQALYNQELNRQLDARARAGLPRTPDGM